MTRPRCTPRRRRTRAVAAGAVFLTTSLAGCYSYAPPEPPGPAPGAQVRVLLTGAGRDRLREATALDMDRVDGTLVEGGGPAEDLAVRIRMDANQLSFGTTEYVDTVQIARGDVRSLDVKTLSRGRSALAGASILVGIGAAYAAIGSGSGGDGNGGENGGQFIVVPLTSAVRAILAVF